MGFERKVFTMEEFANALMDELECRTAFTIPIFGGIDVPESVLMTWIIMAAIVILCRIFVRNLKMVPEGPQIIIEMLISWLNNFFMGNLGKKGKRYLPFLETLIIYIAVANLVGLVGLRPPTKDLNVTAGLAIMSIVYIQICGIREKGVKKWLHSFKEPMALLLPINVLELFIRPLSLCMRLFGNVLGAFVVMELIKLCIPVAIPVAFSAYFDVFDGLIQAYVFVFLTSLFLAEAIEDAE